MNVIARQEFELTIMSQSNTLTATPETCPLALLRSAWILEEYREPEETMGNGKSINTWILPENKKDRRNVNLYQL